MLDEALPQLLGIQCHPPVQIIRKHVRYVALCLWRLRTTVARATKPAAASNYALDAHAQAQWAVAVHDSALAGTRVLGTRPNISDFHSEISTRVPFRIADRLSS